MDVVVRSIDLCVLPARFTVLFSPAIMRNCCSAWMSHQHYSKTESLRSQHSSSHSLFSARRVSLKPYISCNHTQQLIVTTLSGSLTSIGTEACASIRDATRTRIHAGCAMTIQLVFITRNLLLNFVILGRTKHCTKHHNFKPSISFNSGPETYD